MGCLMLYPADFRKPTDNQVEALIHLLVGEGILTDGSEDDGFGNRKWNGGANWGRLGILSRWDPMTWTHHFLNPDDYNPDEVGDDWEPLIARSHFYVAIQDAGAPWQVDTSDPIWRKMAAALGSEFEMAYFHI